MLLLMIVVDWDLFMFMDFCLEVYQWVLLFKWLLMFVGGYFMLYIEYFDVISQVVVDWFVCYFGEGGEQLVIVVE